MGIRQLVRMCVATAIVGAATVGHLWAQGAEKPFLGVDVHIGGTMKPDPPKDGPPPERPYLGGWETGALFRFLPKARWVGVVTTYGSHGSDLVHTREVMAGVRATSPWIIGDGVGTRGFAHALVGRAWGEPVVGAREGSQQLVVGAGFDALLFRLQVDWVHTALPYVPRNDARVFLGAMVPFCVRGCRPDGVDGFDVSRGR